MTKLVNFLQTTASTDSDNMDKIFLIINKKTAVIAILSVISTYICIRYSILADYPLSIFATAIIFPIVFSINSAYKRREIALGKYSALKSMGTAIFFATRDWLDKPSKENINKSKSLLEELLSACKDFFTSSSDDLRKNERAVYIAFSGLSIFIKNDLRNNGMGPSEVSRVNQYLSKMLISFEDAKHIYQYATPRSLRSFSSLFISTLPILYGPYFAHEASQYSEYVTYVMPVLFSLVLVSLSNIQDHLENPFDGVGEDDITINVDQYVSHLDELDSL